MCCRCMSGRPHLARNQQKDAHDAFPSPARAAPRRVRQIQLSPSPSYPRPPRPPSRPRIRRRRCPLRRTAAPAAARARRRPPEPHCSALGAQQPAGLALLPKQRSGVVPGEVIVGMDAGTSVTGGLVAGTRVAARLPITSDVALNAALKKAGASALDPLFASTPAATVQSLSRAATAQLGSVPRICPRRTPCVADKDSTTVAIALAKIPGVIRRTRRVCQHDGHRRPVAAASILKAAPARPRRLDGHRQRPRRHTGLELRFRPGSNSSSSSDDNNSSIPGNYAVADSAQAMLNAGGVDAMGAYSILTARTTANSRAPGRSSPTSPSAT